MGFKIEEKLKSLFNVKSQSHWLFSIFINEFHTYNYLIINLNSISL